MQVHTPITTPGSSDVRALLEGLRERRARTALDRDIGKRVRDVMEGDLSPSVHGLHFYVFEGAVSVYGAVSTFADRDCVVTALAAVPGINQIADHLTVLS